MPHRFLPTRPAAGNAGRRQWVRAAGRPSSAVRHRAGIHRYPWSAGALLCAVAIAALSACSSGQTSTNPNTSSKKHSGAITISYIQKQGDQAYFVDEMSGAQQEAKQLGGVSIIPVNVGMDNTQTVAAVKNAIARKVNGIIIVPPDGSTGPQDAALAKAAGIPIISSDDEVCTTSPNPDQCPPGKLLPRVGFDAQQLGTAVGKEVAVLFKKESGWNASNTRILEEWQFSTSVCTPRVTYAEKLFRSNGGPAATSIPAIKVDTDNTTSGDPSSAFSKTQSTINAYHGIKHWIVWGCNDQNVQGAITALSDAGYSTSDILGVGLGGDVACKDWQSSAPTGMKAALMFKGQTVGADAVKAMVAHLRNGTPFPPVTAVSFTMANKSNWKSTGFVCH
jgi:L-arabinose transport system substrate-binding protein